MPALKQVPVSEPIFRPSTLVSAKGERLLSLRLGDNRGGGRAGRARHAGELRGGVALLGGPVVAPSCRTAMSAYRSAWEDIAEAPCPCERISRMITSFINLAVQGRGRELFGVLVTVVQKVFYRCYYLMFFEGDQYER
jgi:hypothetical protein